MRSVSVHVTIVALLWAAPAAAEERALSLQQSIELARQHSLELRARGLEVRAARAQERQAFGRLLPSVELSGRAEWVTEVEPARLEAPGLPAGTEISFGEPIDRIYFFRGRVTQPIFDGLRRVRTLEAARIGVSVEERRLDELDAELVLQVHERYLGLYRARALTVVTLASVSALEAHLGQLSDLAGAGRATELEVAHGEARLADARADLVAARGAERVAADALRVLLGLPGGVSVKLVEGPLEVRAPLPEGARLAELALAGRPELRTARARAELDARRVSIERAAWFPVISGAAGYTIASPHERYPPPQEVFDRSWDLGLGVSWSLDFGVTHHRVDEARFREQAARHRVQALEDQTSLEVQGRLVELETAEQRLVAARRAAEAAGRAYAHALNLFAAGRLDSAQLLDRELDSARAQVRVLDARVELTLSRARVERLLGQRR